MSFRNVISTLGRQALIFLGLLSGLAQPVTNSGPLVSLDFDDNGTPDLVYAVNANMTGDLPENWMVGFGIEPWGASRFVRAANTRLPFLFGEIVSSNRRALTNYAPDPPLPPSESYGVLLLFYRAIGLETWEYSTPISAFEGESELLLGLRLALITGTHYGWLCLSRPVVDSHTPFELVEYAVHPVPDEPIPAGEPPPLPSIHTQIDPEELTFSWDPRWGWLLLESTTNLVPPVSWEPVQQAVGGPLTLPLDDPQRFYRLRLPP